MDIELSPLQPPEIEAAIAAALSPADTAAADPWWQAGLDEALEA